jgi:hypothetical protein
MRFTSLSACDRIVLYFQLHHPVGLGTGHQSHHFSQPQDGDTNATETPSQG